MPFAAAVAGGQLLGLTDSVVVGSLGADVLAAATAAAMVFGSLAIAIFGLHSGAAVLCAQATGRGDFLRFGRIVRSSIIVPSVIAIGCAIVGSCCGDRIITALVGPLPSAHQGAVYLGLRCVSLIPMVVTGLAVTVLGAAGSTVFMATALLLLNGIHVPLLLVLALGMGTHHAFGLAGAGVSSLTSELLVASYAVVIVYRRRELCVFAGFGFEWSVVRSLVSIGLPQMVYLLVTLAPEVIMINLLSPAGDRYVAAYRSLTLLSDITLAVPLGLQSASQTLIGQRLGAGDICGAQRVYHSALRYGIALSTLAAVGVAALSWPLAAIASCSPTLATLAAAPIALQMITLPLKGYALVGLAPLRAVGDTRYGMTIGVLVSGAVLALAWYGTTELKLELFAVPLAWIGGWTAWCFAVQTRLRGFDWNVITRRAYRRTTRVESR